MIYIGLPMRGKMEANEIAEQHNVLDISVYTNT